jgi:catechol 2,3-dioxygenase-like lactoylglutathione lyase family enzyme
MSSSAVAGPSEVTATVLDHIAVAVERWTDAWPRYVNQLGGQWYSGGVNVGFSPAQLSFANGAKVEVLQPWEPEANPFLRRFLDHNGPGPHHLTFKVPDIEDALGRVRGAGFEPVGVRLEDPQWREAFLHPRQAFGVVVQVAQEQFEWMAGAPEGFPRGSAGPAAALRHVTHAVADLEAALSLFAGLLGGEISGRGVGQDGIWDYVDLAWDRPLGLRLVAPTAGAGPASALKRWLGDRTGRVHHLAFEWTGPGVPFGDAATFVAGPVADGVPGLLAGPGLVQAVAAEDNLGTGLVLRARDGR